MELQFRKQLHGETEVGWLTETHPDFEQALLTVYPTQETEQPTDTGYLVHQGYLFVQCVGEQLSLVVFRDKQRKEVYDLAEHRPIRLQLDNNEPFRVLNRSTLLFGKLLITSPGMPIALSSWTPTTELESQNGAIIDYTEYQG